MDAGIEFVLLISNGLASLRVDETLAGVIDIDGCDLKQLTGKTASLSGRIVCLSFGVGKQVAQPRFGNRAASGSECSGDCYVRDHSCHSRWMCCVELRFQTGNVARVVLSLVNHRGICRLSHQVARGVGEVCFTYL